MPVVPGRSLILNMGSVDGNFTGFFLLFWGEELVFCIC